VEFVRERRDSHSIRRPNGSSWVRGFASEKKF